ncbi:MAG TPA: PQQ-dependent sugar dehydrogenase [Termitinemataceae bacterium]|nr:PQQ-dependent sugar dehydrogenase [Termitinemataceae bacterium]HOM24173.1 PQQ-dependent sugar dehydrogenase [Termitinemataceae bacterium]HPQ01194.1 PQQ-dependent sugar dehydrogenase [Termitinemataceae bacterium]
MKDIVGKKLVMGILFLGITLQLGFSFENNLIAEVSSRVERFRVVQLASGLEYPWGLAFLPDGSLLVTERVGRMWILREGRTRQLVVGLPSMVTSGQGGLLDVALDPAFRTNRWVYFSYAAPGPRGTSGTAVARARLEGNQLRGLQVLYDMKQKTSSALHFGSRIVFGRDGMLYISTGERGERNRAQDLSDTAGKVLRIHPDGRIPQDNPWVTQRNRGIPAVGVVVPEIYTYGHRNIQGMAVHPETGKIWIHEHGPRGGDEINVLIPGANYGWPIITYGREYSGNTPIGEGTHKEGMEQPLLQWTPSIAPSGMTFYTGDRFSRWKGNLFVGSLVGQHLRRLVLNGEQVVEEEVLLPRQLGRIRDVRTGPDGLLYVLTDEKNGGIFRLEPVS